MTTNQAPLPSGFGARTSADEVITGYDLKGKIAIVTGGHAGLGLETSRVLAGAGATVIIGARDIEKAKAAVAKIKGAEVLQLDLAVPSSVDKFAAAFLKSKRPLHLLINNAGVMAMPLARDERGYEMQFATNHLGHFQLTGRLWEALKQVGGARVVALTSSGHRFAGVDLEDPNFKDRPYDKWKGYGQSKTANSLFAVELDKRAQKFAVRAFAAHPGGILTDLIRHMPEEELAAWGISKETRKVPERFKTVEQGAATTVWCAVSTKLNGKGGVYCEDCDISAIADPKQDEKRVGVYEYAVDKDTAAKLWTLSEKLTSVSGWV